MASVGSLLISVMNSFAINGLATIMASNGLPYVGKSFQKVAQTLNPSHWVPVRYDLCELRCAMASFHLTLEEHGRYLTTATAVLLQQQIVPWVEIMSIGPNKICDLCG